MKGESARLYLEKETLSNNSYCNERQAAQFILFCSNNKY